MLKPADGMLPFIEQARQAASMPEIGKAAADALRANFGKTGAALVMGPVTSVDVITGGKPSIRQNLAALENAIASLSRYNSGEIPVFNHLVFRPFIDHFRRKWAEETKTHPRSVYFTPILPQFFGLILDTGLVSTAFFLPRSGRAKGCRYVREKLAEQKGSRLIYLDAQLNEYLDTKLKTPVQM